MRNVHNEQYCTLLWICVHIFQIIPVAKGPLSYHNKQPDSNKTVEIADNFHSSNDQPTIINRTREFSHTEQIRS